MLQRNRLFTVERLLIYAIAIFGSVSAPLAFTADERGVNPGVDIYQELAFLDEDEEGDDDWGEPSPAQSGKEDKKPETKEDSVKSNPTAKSESTAKKDGEVLFDQEAYQADEYKTGRMAFLFGQYDIAMKYWLPLAENGYAKAQATLGWMYHTGKGVKADSKLALEWYRKAADQNHTIALNNIGVFYEQGIGVRKDLGIAAKWYREAAEWGYSYAQYNLGLLYKEGRGVKKDMKEAQFWLQIAALQGVEQAVNTLMSIKVEVHPKQDKVASSKKPASTGKHKPDTLQFHRKDAPASGENPHGSKDYSDMYARIRSDRVKRQETVPTLGPDGLSLDYLNQKPSAKKSEPVKKPKKKTKAKANKKKEKPATSSPVTTPVTIVKSKEKHEDFEKAKNKELVNITRKDWIPNQKFDQWLADAEQAQHRLKTQKEQTTHQGHTVRVFNDEWVRDQNPKQYTLQLARSDDLEKLLAFTKKQVILKDIAYFTSEEKGKVWYNLIYGTFKSFKSAADEIESLPNTLKKWSPYVRKFSDLQSSMKPITAKTAESTK